MTDPIPQRDDDVTEGWPGAPEAGDLADLGRQIRAARQPLPPDAMARIRQAMEQELSASAKPARTVRLWLAAAAAAVLLAVGAWALYQTLPPTPGPEVAHPLPAPAAGPDDTYVVRLAPMVARAPARPLLPLEEYRALYTNLTLPVHVSQAPR